MTPTSQVVHSPRTGTVVCRRLRMPVLLCTPAMLNRSRSPNERPNISNVLPKRCGTGPRAVLRTHALRIRTLPLPFSASSVEAPNARHGATSAEPGPFLLMRWVRTHHGNAAALVTSPLRNPRSSSVRALAASYVKWFEMAASAGHGTAQTRLIGLRQRLALGLGPLAGDGSSPRNTSETGGSGGSGGSHHQDRVTGTTGSTSTT